MKNKSSDNLPEHHDPDENKRIENELLQLKLKAELGIDTNISENTPPSIKNIFLKNILAFENGLVHAQEIRIFQLIGEPEFVPEHKLSDASIKKAFKNLMNLVNKNQIALDFLGSYDYRTKYKFITEELFEEKVMNMQLPEMIIHFIYEEFHPNHELDIEHKAERFINSWLNQEKEQLCFSLADALILPDRRVWNKDKLMDRFSKVFDSYTQFKNGSHKIEDIHIEMEGDAGLGHAEGFMKFKALTEGNDVIEFEGSFKLYFILEYGWWSIYYFIMPGFQFTED